MSGWHPYALCVAIGLAGAIAGIRARRRHLRRMAELRAGTERLDAEAERLETAASGGGP